MTYTKLLLSTGGGIISTQQQARQVQNTATLLIGLGGTGIDAIKTIKAAVRERLLPDDPEAVVPTYSHIQFLGVDTDKRSFRNDEEIGMADQTPTKELKTLDDTEIFDISNPNINVMLSNPKALALRKELNWLNFEDLKVPDLTNAGAGGFRQVGRLLMMDRSAQFVATIQERLNRAKTGLLSPDVNIHIFSGMGGGTGSGIFLDVCYLVKQALGPGSSATVFGYFFLPDVNLSRIPMENTLVRQYIPCNGYAAMQELDYCMRLGTNGDSFVQTYQNNLQVKWDAPPVAMCHLISATDLSHNVIPNAYNFSMNVTAEYIMDFLTEPVDPNNFGLRSHLSNFRTQVNTQDGNKKIGAELAYLIIGGSCASIPLREINTYLASQVFGQFSQIQEHMPTANDVMNMALDAKVGDYNMLMQELSEGVAGLSHYTGEWKETRDFGDSTMVTFYTDQTAKARGKIEENCKSMISEQNDRSLINRIHASLGRCCANLEQGPAFAYRMLEAAQSHNLLNIIDGLLTQNRAMWDQEAAQDRYSEYEYARDQFFYKPNKRRHDEYIHRVEVLSNHDLYLTMYQQLDTILNTLRQQVVKATGSYYAVLYRVMRNLIETFQENSLALDSEDFVLKSDDFAVPLMTIKEVRPKLDEQIARLDLPNMLADFMQMFLSNPSEWIQEDENKITRLVTNYFVNTAFSDFSNRTLTAFLCDKYGTNNNEVITHKLYQQYISRLASRSDPLFPLNSVWNPSMVSQTGSISVPAAAAPVVAAANMLHNNSPLFNVKQSALTDRIYLMRCALALPLGAYANCGEYENNYFSSIQAGRHYYEGKPDSMIFNDWRKLPSLTPESHVNYDFIPLALRSQLEEIQKLYAVATSSHLIQGDQIFTLSEASVQALQTAMQQAQYARNKAKAEPQKAGVILNSTVQMLSQAVSSVQLVFSGYTLPHGSQVDQQSVDTVRRDYFFSSPMVQIMVRGSIEAIQRATEEMETIKKELEEMGSSDKALNDFFHILFTGIFQLKTPRVLYHKVDFGIPTEIVLSQLGAEFPYASIPLYQAYKSYQAMDSEERKELCAKANDRMNNGDPEMIATMQALDGVLGDKYNANMAQNAIKFPQDYEEIISFIKKLTIEFQNLKGLFNI